MNEKSVEGILNRHKTQTRRVVPAANDFCEIGDVFWVREKWRVGTWDEEYGSIAVDYSTKNLCRSEQLPVPDYREFERLWIESTDDAIASGADTDDEGRFHWGSISPCRWRDPCTMQMWASRLKLRITDLKRERLQEISESDAVAEGAKTVHDFQKNIWGSIYPSGEKSWDANPTVLVIGFEMAADLVSKNEREYSEGCYSLG